MILRVAFTGACLSAQACDVIDALSMLAWNKTRSDETRAYALRYRRRANRPVLSCIGSKSYSLLMRSKLKIETIDCPGMHFDSRVCLYHIAELLNDFSSCTQPRASISTYRISWLFLRLCSALSMVLFCYFTFLLYFWATDLSQIHCTVIL